MTHVHVRRLHRLAVTASTASVVLLGSACGSPDAGVAEDDGDHRTFTIDDSSWETPAGQTRAADAAGLGGSTIELDDLGLGSDYTILARCLHEGSIDVSARTPAGTTVSAAEECGLDEPSQVFTEDGLEDAPTWIRVAAEQDVAEWALLVTSTPADPSQEP